MSSWFGGGKSKAADAAKPITPMATAADSHNGEDLIRRLRVPADLAWAQERSGATETQTWYVDVQDAKGGNGGGGLLFVQLVYSTIGLSASVQATSRYYDRQTGQNVMASTSYSGSAFKLSADRCSVQVQEDGRTFIRLLDGDSSDEYRAPAYAVKQTHDGKLAVEFEFRSSTPAVQIRDGKTLLGENGTTGYVWHRFAPSGTVSGTIAMEGGAPQPFQGRGAFIHAVQNAKPHQVATSWDCFSLQFGGNNGPSASGAVLLLQFRAPAEFGAVTVTQGLIVRGGKVIGVTADASSKHTSTAVDESTKYPVPTAVQYRWAGKAFTAAVDAQLQTLVGKVDILGELPYLLRKVLQALIAKPFAYIWFDKVTGQLVVDGQTVEISGHAYMETTFINSE